MNRQLGLGENGFWLLEYAIAMFALIILYLTLLAGAYLGYEVLLSPNKGSLEWDAIIAGGLVVALGFGLSLGVISFEIEKRNLEFLRRPVFLAAGLVAGGMLLVEGKMGAKALDQGYGIFKFILHTGLLITATGALLLLEQIHSYKLKWGRQERFSPEYIYAIFLLGQEGIHFLGMLLRYVKYPPEQSWHVVFDLAVFTLVFLIALALVGRCGKIINLLASKLTKTILTV